MEEYVNEKKYKKHQKKLILISISILIVGLLVGGSIIAKGLKNQTDLNLKYSEENKQILEEELKKEREQLTAEQKKIKSKINSIYLEISKLKDQQKNYSYGSNEYNTMK